MTSAPRRIAAIVLIVAGLACMGFFGLLHGMADCGPDCQARGERAPVYALIGLGLGLVVLGAMLGRGTLRATGAGMLAGGAISLSGLLIVIVMEGGRGAMVWVTLAVSVGFALVGAWLSFWRPR